MTSRDDDDLRRATAELLRGDVDEQHDAAARLMQDTAGTSSTPGERDELDALADLAPPSPPSPSVAPPPPAPPIEPVVAPATLDWTVKTEPPPPFWSSGWLVVIGIGVLVAILVAVSAPAWLRGRRAERDAAAAAAQASLDAVTCTLETEPPVAAIVHVCHDGFRDEQRVGDSPLALTRAQWAHEDRECAGPLIARRHGFADTPVAIPIVDGVCHPTVTHLAIAGPDGPIVEQPAAP